MWKALDRIVSAIIRRLFKPKYHVERVERYQLPGRLRIVKWCAAPQTHRRTSSGASSPS